MDIKNITSALVGTAKRNLDIIIFSLLVIAAFFYIAHLINKVDEAKTYEAMQQKLIHDYEVEQKYLEDNKASILKDMEEAQKKQEAIYAEYLKSKKVNEDKLQNADSRLQDLDGCIRLVSFECTQKDTNKNASGGAVSTVP